MNAADPLVLPISRGADKLCQLMWLFMRQEPEVVALAEERHALGFPHYLTSRMGVISPDRWADEVFIAPRSLVEHLRPRCEALRPPEYVDAALNTAGRALARLMPHALLPSICELAESVEADGALAGAWATWPRSGDPHRDAIRAAMVIREDRAHGHYRAVAEAQLAPLEMMVLTQVWRGRDLDVLSRGFKWGDEDVASAQATLHERGLLTQAGITEAGRSLRERIEEATNRWASRYLGSVDDRTRSRLAAELEQLTGV